jgi:hypothetical protein
LYDISAQKLFNDEHSAVFGNTKIDFSFLSKFETDFPTLEAKID